MGRGDDTEFYKCPLAGGFFLAARPGHGAMSALDKSAVPTENPSPGALPALCRGKRPGGREC
jgi:hypothetical protein